MGQYSKLGNILFLALAFLLISSTFAFATTIYVKTDGNDSLDGLSWDTAKKTVQAGLDTATSGGQVWVAAGTYVQRITLKSGVALYGGLPASGGDWGTRNVVSNVTILDGNWEGSVVTVPSGATTATMIDGFTIRSGSVTDVSFYTYGGAIYCSSSATISNNTISGNGADYGGGIYCSSSSPTITNNTISGNGADYGGAIYCSSSSPTISNNTIGENSAYDGGGIYCSSSSPTISNNTVSGNNTYNSGFGYGGGIYCDSSSSPAITNNTISGNGVGEYGGGICCWSSSVTITNNTISGNSAASYGGGIYGGGTISNNTITGNTVGQYGYASAYSSGGGIYAWGTVSILSNRIESNMASGTGGDSEAYGGGVYLSGGSPLVRNNLIKGNRADTTSRNFYGYGYGSAISFGGGIYAENCSPTISGNLVVENQANASCDDIGFPGPWRGANAWGGGIGLGCSSNSASVTNNTVASNSAYSSYYWGDYDGSGMQSYGGCGGGIYCYLGASSHIANNIIAFSTSGGGISCWGTDTLHDNDVYQNAESDYCGGAPGTGDISLDPLFADRDNGDYHLHSSSPCVDAGTNTGAPATDIEGCIRPQDGDGNGTAICDIGAYEYPLNLSNAKKNLANGSAIAFGGVPVTACFSSAGRVYVEKPDRSLGIRVDTSKAFGEGEMVNVSGTIQTETATGERYIQASSSYPATMDTSLVLSPLGMTNLTVGGEDSGLQKGVIGGFGVNNIGLLVTIWGAVTEFDDPENPSLWFKVDDGSQANVKVQVRTGVTINKNWEYAIVTGVVSCEKSGDDLLPVIKVRKQADIVPL